MRLVCLSLCPGAFSRSISSDSVPHTPFEYLSLLAFLSLLHFFSGAKGGHEHETTLFFVLKHSFPAYVAWSRISGCSSSCRESIVGIPGWFGLFYTVAFPILLSCKETLLHPLSCCVLRPNTHTYIHIQPLQNKTNNPSDTYTCFHCYSSVLLGIVFPYIHTAFVFTSLYFRNKYYK